MRVSHPYCTHIGMNTWHFQTPICTGLGDRLGIVLALSALASLHGDNTTVWMEWCSDPQKVVLTNAVFFHYIPRWTGWDYPLDRLQTYIKMPANVKFYSSDERPPSAPPVMIGHELPSENGITQASTLYWRTLRLTDKTTTWTPLQYLQAYKSVPLTPVGEAEFPYILVHFRGPDHNTHDCDRSRFCTRQAISALRLKIRAHFRAISNNYTDALHWLRGLPSIEVVHGSNAFAGMQLALNAAAIIQHAPVGWSAYTSVPAMAKSIPLINTYDGREHRHAFFAHHGGLPAEFHTCMDIQAFIQTVAQRFDQNDSR